MNSVRPIIWLVTSALVISTPIASAEVIFEENFDAQPDYVSRDHLSGVNHQLYRASGDPIPSGWDSISDWSQYDLPHLIITGSDAANQAKGGTGKSLVMRRASRGPGWSGDAQLAKNLDRDYKEIYVKFWIKFQPGWTHSGFDKLFRIGSYKPDELSGKEYWSRLGMGVIWDLVHYDVSMSGLRNSVSAVSSQGRMENPTLGVLSGGWKPNNKGWNANFGYHAYDLDGDGLQEDNPQLTDYVNGGALPSSGSLSHSQVFSDGWHKVEFYLKMNSAPGAQDGIMTQWLDDTKVIQNSTVPWLQAGDSEVNRGFNAIKFGGNDNFMVYPNKDRVQEWYAFDDIVVRSSLPPERRSAKPGSPTGVHVE